MAAPKITISNPKAMTKSDFESLRGTALYIRMFRNRCLVKVTGLNDAKDIARKEIESWLRDNCNSLYYVVSGELSWVYIENATDAVNFKMFFHDMDVEIPVPPPPPKPKAPAQPAKAPVKQSASELMDWMKLFNDHGKSWQDESDFDDLLSDHGLSEDTVKKIASHIHKNR